MTPRDETPPAAALGELVARCADHDLATVESFGWQPTLARGQHVAQGVAGAAALPHDLVAAVSALATSTDLLLLLGSDDRVVPHAGRNSYGFPICDRQPVALLSSCTASPPGAADLVAVDTWRRGLLDRLVVTHRSIAPGEWRAPIATAIAELVGLPPDQDRRLVLIPSGTDAEALAAAIAVYSHGRQVVNVVVGAIETGSGTVRAAGGLRTTATTPLRGEARVGDPLDGLGPDLIRVVTVDVRDARGRARRPFDVEAEVEAHVEAALSDGATVLVHALDCSKTGLSYLNADWVATWRGRHPSALRVLVDSAQARTTRERIQGFLAAGASVIVTGSKAICGAPFAGVLMLDDAFLADAESCDRLPAGLASMLSTADLPEQLSGLAAGWEPVNLGLLARWQTAIVQHSRYLTIPVADRVGWRELVVTRLANGLREVGGVDVLPPIESSIVSFTVSGAAGPLGREPLGHVHRALADVGIYLGQPTELVSDGQAVLRAAVGAATLTAAADTGDPVAALDSMVSATVAAIRDQVQTYSRVT